MREGLVKAVKLKSNPNKWVYAYLLPTTHMGEQGEGLVTLHFRATNNARAIEAQSSDRMPHTPVIHGPESMHHLIPGLTGQ